MPMYVPTVFAVCLLFAGAGHALAAPELPAALILPRQIDLPDPWGVLKALLLLTFFIHLLLVNILIGSTLLTLGRRCLRKQPPGFSLGEELSFLPKVLALAVNFGVAPYLFTQVIYGSFLYSSSVLMAVWWLSAALFIMLAYYGLYIAGADHSAGLPRSRLTLAFSALLLLCAAFVMSSNSTLMLRPEYWSGWFARPGGTMLNLGDPSFVPRYLHIVLGSLALGGLTLACRARWKAGAAAELPELREGLAWFFRATALQIPVGVCFLLTLPERAPSFWAAKPLPRPPSVWP